MKKLVSILLLLLLIASPFATQSFTTNVDDYTNSKGGAASKTYNFTLDGTSMNAVGNSTSATNMTWSQWLNIKADGFNNSGFGIASTGGLTTLGITTYTVKYNSTGGTSFNDDLVPSGTAATLPTPTRTGWTFSGWYTAASGGSKIGTAGASYTPTSSTTLYAHWTANPLIWAAKTYDLKYNTNAQTITLDKPTNGTNSGVTFTATATSALSVSSDGKITVKAGTTAGKYQIAVTATDNESRSTITKTMTVYVRPIMQNPYNGNNEKTQSKMAIGESVVSFKMYGLSSVSSNNVPTSSAGTFTIINDSVVLTLSAPFDGDKTVNVTIKVADKNYTYSLSIVKEPKALTVYGAETTYNRKAQTPVFYTWDGTPGYEKQADLFTWTLSGGGLSANATQATNVVRNSGDAVGTYTLNVAVKSITNKPLVISDSTNPSLAKKTTTFKINPFEINSTNTTLTVANRVYTGSKTNLNPTVITTIDGSAATIVKDKDYFVYTTNTSGTKMDAVNVGSYKMVIKGKGNYTGGIETTFNITQKNINELTVSSVKEQYWTGSAITPGVTLTYNGITLEQGKDYTVSYSNNVNIANSTATNAPTITITGKGNYAGTKTVKFSIVSNKFDQHVSIVNGQATYTGNATNGGAKVSVSNKLFPTTTYSIKYGTTAGTYNLNSIPTFTDVGNYTVYFKISGSGYSDYLGSVSIKINQANNVLKIKENGKEINSAKLIVPGTKSYTFETIFDTVVSASSTDYVNIAINNSNKTITLTPLKAGSGDIKFTAAPKGNNVKGAATTISVKVLNGTISDNTADLSGTYSGSAYTLKASYMPADATVKYTTNNSQTNAGTYKVNYEISKTGYETVYGSKTLTIVPKTIGDSWIQLEYTSREYTGAELKPNVTVKDGSKTLVNGKDYIVSYINNILPANNATVTVTGIGNYQGKVEKHFTITAKTMTVVTNSYELDYTSFETNGTKEQRENAVRVVSASAYNITYCTTDSDSAQAKGNCTQAENFSVSIPKFTHVGTHNVKVKVEAIGYNTVMTDFNIKINKRLITLPVVSQPEGYLYTGKMQEPSWIGYNSNFVSKKGVSRASQPGTYEEIFSLKDTTNTAWILENGTQTLADQKFSWKIVRMSIKDHETVIDDYIKYNEWKQLEVQDGKTAFERVGYTQTAWVEDCKDVAGSGVEERVCNYNKTISLTDPSVKTQQECESKGESWNNGKCYHINLFDIGSSISGMYVEKTTNPTCSLEAKTAETGYSNDKNDSYDLYAVWSKITYRIQYELCDSLGCGKFNDSATSIVSYDQEFTVPNPSRIGYIFAGWTITEMDDTPHVINGITTSENEYTVPKDWVQHGNKPTYKNLTSSENATVVMTANWDPIEYTLIYSGNKSTYKENAYTTLANAPVTTATLTGTMSNQHMSYDNPVRIPTNNYQLVGYTFTGWSTSPNGKTSSGAACVRYTHDLADPYKYVTDDNSRCLTFDNAFMAQTGGKNLIQNLTIDDQDVIVMYAQWKQNTNTRFTITYWAQKIGTPNDYNSSNYNLVGTETYTGLTDGMVTLQPYWYGSVNSIPDNKSTSKLSGTKLVNSSPSDTTAKYRVTSATKSGNYNIDTFTVAGTSTLNNNVFRGFTLQYPQTVESSTSNNQNPNGYNTKLKNTYTYVIKPDGSTNINVYYTRNTYNVTINTNQISSVANDGNPNTRQYQVSMTLQNPLNASNINGSLVNNGANKTNDAGYKAGNGVASANNSGLANFQAWYYNNALTNQITYIDGEVSKPETIWAKWYQYRYTSAGSGAWNNWGVIDE